MIKTFRITDGKICEAAPQEAQVFVFICPDDKEKAQLVSQEGIDEHTLNSTLDPDELGRLEFESNHAAAIIKKPKRYQVEDNFLFKVSSVGLFLFADKLIIVSSEQDSLLEGRGFSKLRTIHDLYLRILFNSIIHFEEHLRVIHKMSDELEQEITKAVSNKDISYMFKLEKSLVYYLNAINSNRAVIEKLKLNSTKIGFSQEATEFLEDVIIENAQCYQQANTHSEVLSSMMDAWVSIINNNLNIRIKMLTILSLCIMTPTLIVSLFSMNVPLPIPQDGTLFSFWFVSALAAASVLTIFLLWRYRKW